MTKVVKNQMKNLRDFFAILGAAMDASTAVRAHRRPSDATLRTLGISPKDFPKFI